MRKVNELLRLSYDMMDTKHLYFEGGLCGLFTNLYYEDVITFKEYELLKRCLKRNRPKEVPRGKGYWWKYGEIEPRKRFLVYLIKCTRPWYINLISYLFGFPIKYHYSYE